MSSDQLWTLLELSTEGVWKWDIVNDEVRWSPTLLSTLGFEPNRKTRLDVLELTHPDDREHHQKTIEEHLRSDAPYYVELRLLKADGSHEWFMGRGLTLRDKDGKPTTLFGYIVSIEGRKRSEDALAVSEAQFRAFMDNSPAAAYMKKQDGTHVYVNKAAAEVVGLPQDEIVGKKTSDFFPPETAEELQRIDHEVLDSGKLRVWTGMVSRQDGSRRFLHDVKFPVPIGDGKNALGGFGMDLSELKDSQETLEAVKRLESVGRLAGGIAHDFNNMLGVILGFSELALASVGDDHPASQSLHGVIDAAGRSAKITKQLLGYARKQTIRPRRLNLENELVRMLDILRRLIGENIRLDTHFDDALRRVRMDPAQLDQVLTNLCINARDAIGHGGGSIRIEVSNVDIGGTHRLTMSGLEPGPYIRLVVADDGSGISEDDLQRLFEPFFTTKEKSKGTGLGLATVYGIVLQNKGHIEVDSKPGEGATFSVYLPEDTNEREETTWKHPVEATKGGGRKLLLVEDEPKLLEVIAQILESLGYEVTPVDNITDALESASENRYDVLVTDLVLREGRGTELADKLVASHPGMQVLYMSGHADPGIQQSLLDNQETHFIQKPFSREDVANALKDLLDS